MLQQTKLHINLGAHQDACEGSMAISIFCFCRTPAIIISAILDLPMSKICIAPMKIKDLSTWLQVHSKINYSLINKLFPHTFDLAFTWLIQTRHSDCSLLRYSV